MLKQIILANANDWALNFRKVVQQQISGEVVTLILASSTLLFWIKSERITITGLRLPVIVKIKKMIQFDRYSHWSYENNNAISPVISSCKAIETWQSHRLNITQYWQNEL